MGIVICFVAVIAMVGTYTFNNYQKQIDEQVAKAEEQAEKLTEDRSKEAATDDIVLPEADNGMEGKHGNRSEGTERFIPVKRRQKKTPVPQKTQRRREPHRSRRCGSVKKALLHGRRAVRWIIGYSMDQTVFFSTLEQYKYNPALVIAGEVGETIEASAAGMLQILKRLHRRAIP